MSVEGTVVQPPGLKQYLLVHGRARIEQGGAADLLQRLAHVYLGPDVRFPPMADPPPGFVLRTTVERLGGVGPWASLARELLAQRARSPRAGRPCPPSPSSPGRRRSRAGPPCRRGTPRPDRGSPRGSSRSSGPSSATSVDRDSCEVRLGAESRRRRCARSPRRTTARGMLARASTSLPSSSPSTAAGSIPAPASSFITTFATARRSPGVARVEPVAAARHEPLGELEVELGLEPTDTRAGQLRTPRRAAARRAPSPARPGRGPARGSSGSPRPPPSSAAA